jgi:hypothetical protein
MGMKSTFTHEIFDAICAHLTEGASLKEACRKVKGSPDESTVRHWVQDDVEGCAPRYSRSRELGADKLFDDCQEMADSAEVAARTAEPGTGNAVVQAIRLRVDTLKWRLARMAPWKYGDKLELTGRLSASDAPKAIEWRVVDAPKRLEPPTVDGGESIEGPAKGTV